MRRLSTGGVLACGSPLSLLVRSLPTREDAYIYNHSRSLLTRIEHAKGIALPSQYTSATVDSEPNTSQMDHRIPYISRTRSRQFGSVLYIHIQGRRRSDKSIFPYFHISVFPYLWKPIVPNRSDTLYLSEGMFIQFGQI